MTMGMLVWLLSGYIAIQVVSSLYTIIITILIMIDKIRTYNVLLLFYLICHYTSGKLSYPLVQDAKRIK